MKYSINTLRLSVLVAMIVGVPIFSFSQNNDSFLLLKWWIFPLVIVIATLVTVSVIKYYKKRYKQECENRLAIKEKLYHKDTNLDSEEVNLYEGKRYNKYKKVTVLFADIQGFTRIVEHMNPEQLIDELDKFFFHFDVVVGKYGIEKIKTIGDAYMCAGGLPEKNRTNPVEVALAAIEMQQYMKNTMHSVKGADEELGFWELRIGVHTGPVISGIIGQKKLSFDIWGDTVNIASRMESSGVASEINITGVTHQLIKEFFETEYRGKMPVKYKGETDMYFVKGIRPELSVNGESKIPNEKFFVRLQHIRFNDIEEFVLEKMENEIPVNMFYHNVNHTKDVITRVEVLGRAEGVSDEQLLFLKTAALLHDIGFVINYENHESNSILFAKELLPKYKYLETQIEKIINLINVTRVNAKPVTLLEKIMKDADLDYLGRPDFVPVSENLFEEIKSFGVHLSLDDWNEMQYDFISNHTYYTKSAKKLRQVNKERQLQKIKELLTA